MVQSNSFHPNQTSCNIFNQQSQAKQCDQFFFLLDLEMDVELGKTIMAKLGKTITFLSTPNSARFALIVER